jgi:mutator protein MutT
MPGYWEFPGGKCEASEAPLACAVREVREEANLSIKVLRLRRVIRHDYPHGDVLLHFFDCETSGPGDEPAPLTGFRWVAAAELPDYQFPGGNTEIVTQLAAEAVLGAWACN